MNNKIIIKDVEISDAKNLLEIYAPYVENTAISFEYKIPSEEEFTNRIKKITEKYPYIKAIDENNKILGYAYASEFKSREAYKFNVEMTIYLKQDMKQQGIGRELYLELEERLKRIGILNANACIAKTNDKNDPYLTNASIEFHKKLGYSMVGTFHYSGYKFNRWYDMVWMEKMIGEHK